MDDDEDDFFDTLSINSTSTGNFPRKHSNNNHYLSLSRHTVYHSVPDLDNAMELTPLDRGNNENHTSKKVRKEVETYERWRNRVQCDLCNKTYCMFGARFALFTLFQHCTGGGVNFNFV